VPEGRRPALLGRKLKAPAKRENRPAARPKIAESFLCVMRWPASTCFMTALLHKISRKP
jgi:hypothetical protein